MEAINFLILPFLACVLIIITHTYYGIHILERGIIFVDLALAQFIGIGIALAFFFGHEGADRAVFSFSFALLGAVILSFSRHIAKLVNIEAFVGVLYVFSFALAILILDRTPHGTEEFKNILSGNILWVSSKDILYTFVVYVFIGAFHPVLGKKFFSLSYEGKGGLLYEFLFFFGFALILMQSVRIAGILQVFSFLIIPALIGRLYTREPMKVLLWGWLTGLGASVFGIVASYKIDLPTAPLIIASLGVTFFVLLLKRSIWHKPRF